MFTLQTTAYQTAIRAHEGQIYGKEGNIPYYNHLYDVVGNITEMYECSADSGEDSVLQAAGWLHDIKEDCGFTDSMLYGIGMTKEVVDIVDAVTKREGETLQQYLDRIVSVGENAIKLKIADSRANLTASLNSPVSDKQQKRIEKYTYNICYLNKALLEIENGKEKEEATS